jgi:integrase
MNRLTARQAETLPDGLHADGGNLYLLVRYGGKGRAWVFRWKAQGKTRQIGLGRLADRSLKEAREIAAKLRHALLNGQDPAAVYAKLTGKAEQVPTFAEAAAMLIESKRPGWRNAKHASQWENTLRDYVLPRLGKLHPQAVGVEHVLACLRPIWTTRPETASRVRQRVEAVLDFCAGHGWRDDANPARWRGKLKALLPEPSKVKRTAHHPALPYARAAEFYRALSERPGMAARCLEFTMLTGCRSGEARGATWREFDLAARLWTVPAERMKAGKEHVVPLSEPVLALLSSLPRMEGSPYVFFAPRGGMLSDVALTALLRRMHADDVSAGGAGWIDPATGRTVTAHGLRSTFRDWSGEVSRHPREVIEHALAHQLKDKAEAAYARGTLLEKRRALMDDWARYVTQPGGVVIQLPKRAGSMEP